MWIKKYQGKSRKNIAKSPFFLKWELQEFELEHQLNVWLKAQKFFKSETSEVCKKPPQKLCTIYKPQKSRWRAEVESEHQFVGEHRDKRKPIWDYKKRSQNASRLLLYIFIKWKTIHNFKKYNINIEHFDVQTTQKWFSLHLHSHTTHIETNNTTRKINSTLRLL